MAGERDREVWISIDETAIDGRKRFYGWGSLWMMESRRGDFVDAVRKIRDAHNFRQDGEFKWSKVKRQKIQFYKDIVDLFFRFPVAFHCMVIRRAKIQRWKFEGDEDLARQVHLYTLVQHKVRRCMKRAPGRPHKFRIWVDPLPSPNPKAAEILLSILNNKLATSTGARAIESVIPRDSKESPSIMMVDLLVGAVVDAFNQDAEAEGKLGLQRYIAEAVGWTDLRADTLPDERKFNIWYLQESNDQGGYDRELVTRTVSLKTAAPNRQLPG